MISKENYIKKCIPFTERNPVNGMHFLYINEESKIGEYHPITVLIEYDGSLLILQ